MPQMELEYISNKAWMSYAKRIERERMKAKGESLTFTAIARAAHGFIVESRSDDATLIVRRGWRAAMRLA